MPADPLARLIEFYEKAAAIGAPEPAAMALATADERGRPSLRYLLLKGVDDRGIRFFTNYASRKGRELDATGYAAATLWWPALDRQVRLEGPVERLAAAESDAYFASRSRGARIGAWASRQSAPLPVREALDARVAELDERFADEDPPRPEWWGGYLLRPATVEVWEGRPDRLHDRTLYTRRPDGGWESVKLYP